MQNDATSAKAGPTTTPAKKPMSPVELPAIPKKFGDNSVYWEEYNKAADKHDKDMTEGLGENLDVLLVFAGLFSGVNTAFIILSLALLSSTPADQTNNLLKLLVLRVDNSTLTQEDLDPPTFAPDKSAIRINCFFAASLTCSLMAAFGAMLGRQWVGHYARTGQLGPLDMQARLRQMKFNGVESYHFRSIVEALPNLLQVALLIFFIGLVDFLMSLNHTVAWVVLSFTIVGFLAYVYTVTAASRDPYCPYQTPVSTITRRSAMFLRYWLVRLKRSLELRTKNGVDDRSYPPHGVVPVNLTWEEDGEVDVTSACWILETSARDEALLAAAHSIPTLHRLESKEFMLNTFAYERLVSLFKDSLRHLMNAMDRASLANPVPDETVASVVLYGRALCHLMIGNSSQAELRNRKALFADLFDSQMPSDLTVRLNISGLYVRCSELWMMLACLVPGNTMQPYLDPLPTSALPLYITSFPTVLRQQSRWQKSLETAIGAVPDSPEDKVVGLAAWVLSASALDQDLETLDSTVEIMWKRRWDAYVSDAKLWDLVLAALEAYPVFEKGTSYEKYHWPYSTLIKAVARLNYYPRGRQAEAMKRLAPQLLQALGTVLTSLALQIGSAAGSETLRAQQKGLLRIAKEIVNRTQEGHWSLEPIWYTATTNMADMEALGHVLYLLSMSRGHVDQKTCLDLFRKYPATATAITNALAQPKLEQSAASMFETSAARWFDHDETDIHQQFIDAGLAAALASNHLPSTTWRVYQLVHQLFKHPQWKEHILSLDFLDLIYASTLKVNAISYLKHAEKIEYYARGLIIWEEAQNDPDYELARKRWVTKDLVLQITEAMRGYVDPAFVKPPKFSIPPSLLTFAEAVNQASLSNELELGVRKQFEEALEDLKVIVGP